MKKDILFLDANILFSAAYLKNAGLLKLWGVPYTKLISSLYAIEEARRNLDEPAQQERLEGLLTSVEKVSFYDDEELPENITLREKDKPILRAAIAAKADYLITGDVRDFGPFYGTVIQGVTILPPADYLNKIRKQ